MTTLRRINGFSLIEVMVVVVIVGILASIAVPAYTSYVADANRAATKQFMLEIGSRQEEKLLNEGSYTGALDKPGDYDELDVSVPDAVADNYDVDFNPDGASAPFTDYTITASPTADSTNAGEADLVVNSDGTKKPAKFWSEK